MKLKENPVMMQYFEWYLSPDSHLWLDLIRESSHLHALGIDALWLPPAYKGASGKNDVGYGVYDLYDLGEFDQKGSIATKYGTKDEYLEAIKTLHEHYIQVYPDIVLNHKMGADETENVPAEMVNPANRNQNISDQHMIEAWTKFTFPNRKGKYSDFIWNASHFDGIDYDERTRQNQIYRFEGKHWDDLVDDENGNYDYLMGADLDFLNEEVRDELSKWGLWYQSLTHMDGVRIDAVKHIHFTFFKDWLQVLRLQNPDLFAVGEYWSSDVEELINYIQLNAGALSLFDVPLHFNLMKASASNGTFDMSKIFDHTLVQRDPMHALTFVDNHDTQPMQALQSWVLDWFKPMAYALILLRQDGYPCIFYGDYYGIPNNNIAPQKDLDLLIHLRKKKAYGKQHDYLDHENIIGWSREGDEEHEDSGLVVLMSNGEGGEKTMYIGDKFAGCSFMDIIHEHPLIKIDSQGCGTFYVDDGSLSIYIHH